MKKVRTVYDTKNVNGSSVAFDLVTGYVAFKNIRFNDKFVKKVSLRRDNQELYSMTIQETEPVAGLQITYDSAVFPCGIASQAFILFEQHTFSVDFGFSREMDRFTIEYDLFEEYLDGGQMTMARR